MRQNRRSSLGLKIASLMLATFLFSNSASHFASASVPSGTDWFEIHSNPFTGLDDTGDGGTGNVTDLNYFYVGQSFDGNIAIQSSGATAANIWVDYNPQVLDINSPLTGDYFESWQNQITEGSRIKSTGYNPSLSSSSGLGNFGLFTIQALKPTASNYGTSSPDTLDINIGQTARTTESNIANSGIDLLDSAEDFQFHVWADTKKPYAKNSNPVNGATDVLVDSTFSFDLLDSLNGASDDSGVGTGVDIDSVAADVTFDDGVESISLKDFMIHTCSGIWGSNLCEIVIDPFALTDFENDTRKWKYGTTYTVEVSGFQDFASPNQNQLGDTNGPNIMNSQVFTFTTENDLVAPQVILQSPEADTNDHPLDTPFSFVIEDRKEYPDGISGSGFDVSTCRVDISSPSFVLQTYSVADTAMSSTPIDYGVQIELDPVEDFSSNETVSIRLYNCADVSENVISELSYTIHTVVLDADLDGVLDSLDQCPNTLLGEAVDANGCSDTQKDSDLDEVNDSLDQCPDTPLGEVVDANGCSDTQKDSDLDEVNDSLDQCPDTPLGEAVDADGCSDTQKDSDSDGFTDDVDNCLLTPNPEQEDLDEDLIGDACDEDIDNDEVLNDVDNCLLIINPEQEDLDEDLIGDTCDDDVDGDTILNTVDNCVFTSNLNQIDEDQDGIGDICDSVTSVRFDVRAIPEKRLHLENTANLNLISDLKFYNLNIGDVYWQDSINSDGNGYLSYETRELAIGNYDVSLKGESHLTKIIRSVTIGTETSFVDLDYTFGDTIELTAGDLYSDDRVNSFDISTMLLSYGAPNSGFSDLNKDGYVNAPDIALIILNYFKQGESF